MLLQACLYANAVNCNYPGSEPEISAYYAISIQSDKTPPGRFLARQFEITAENIRFRFIILYPARKYLGLLFSRDGTAANSLVARECPWEKWQRETTLLTFFRYNTAGITRGAFAALNFWNSV